MWDSIIKPTLVLVVVCIIISGSLAWVNGMTKDVITENAEIEKEAFRTQVLQAADSFTEVNQKGISDAVKSVYAGYSGNQLTGYVMDVATKGYGGDISMTVGVDVEGQVTGVIIGSNNETPGLGSKATMPDFTGQFTGVNLEDALNAGLQVVKQNKKAANEIQAVSGATISSRGITSGVQAALEAVEMIEGGD